MAQWEDDDENYGIPPSDEEFAEQNKVLDSINWDEHDKIDQELASDVLDLEQALKNAKPNGAVH
jgi:hypothetical protein